MIKTFIISLAFNTVFQFAFAQEFELTDSSKTIHPADSVFCLRGTPYSEFVEVNDFNKGFINDPLQLIQGRIPGLAIVKAGSDPNENFDIRIRGINSINCQNRPLIVIDGIPDTEPENIDPNDIESFRVLKDASVTALYGIRGSAGVILINTKRGNGTPRIDYEGYTSVEHISRAEKVLSASGYRAFSKEFLYGNAGADYLNSTDWLKEISRPAYSQVHHISLSGGNPHSSYRASLNYRGVQGVEIHSGFRQVNGNFSIQQKALKDKLKAFLEFNGIYRVSEYGNGEAFLQASIFNPTAPVKVDAGTKLPADLQGTDFTRWNGYFNLENSFRTFNPVQILEDNTHDGTRGNYHLSGNLSYEILKGLEAGILYSLQADNFLDREYFDRTSFYSGYYRNGYASQNESASQNQYFESSASWSNNSGNPLQVSVKGGYSYQEFINQGFQAAGGNFLTDFFLYNNLAAAKDFSDGRGTVESFKNSNRIIGFYSNADLSWRDTYFISVVARYDGSSRTGKNHKWGFFPGMNAGIELTRFLNIPGVDKLRIYGGYGKAGNNLPSDNLSRYLLNTYALSSYHIGTYYNGDYVPQYFVSQNANDNLKWETKTEINFGLAFGLFSSKIRGNLEYYSNTISDLLQQFYVDSPPDFSNITWANAGKLKNSGLEFSAGWKVLDRKNFHYSVELNYTKFLSDEIVSLSDKSKGFVNGPVYYTGDIGYVGSSIPVIRVEEGKPVGQMYGLVYTGIDNNGNWIYKDVNGDGRAYGESNDQTVIGNGMPKAELGFSHRLKYKKWELDVFFRGMFGHNIYNEYRSLYEKPSIISAYNIPESATGLRSPDGTYLFTTGGWISSFYAEKAGYLRLDNFQVSYDCPFKSGSVHKMKIYLAGNNVLVLTKYKGPDPEVRYQTNGAVIDPIYGYLSVGNALAPGIDRATTWPMSMSFSLGINLEL